MVSNIRYIKNLIRGLISLGILMYFFYISKSFHIIFIPFIIAVIIGILKNIFMIFNLNKLILIIDKLFIVNILTFLFGFIAYYCYLSIKNGNILSVIYTFPFWFVGICILYKNIKE